MAVILVVLGALAGLIAARAVKKAAPPVPSMAIEEARKIRESGGHGRGACHGRTGPAAASSSALARERS